MLYRFQVNLYDDRTVSTNGRRLPARRREKRRGSVRPCLSAGNRRTRSRGEITGHGAS